MPSAILTSRGVVAVTGPERKGFLQGLVTNDVTRLGPGQPLYAAMLTPQGKYLFDFLMVEDGETIYLDAEKARAADLVRRLMMYRLRARVEISDESGKWTVVAGWGDAVDFSGGCLVFDDPRHPDLGMRALCPVAVDAGPEEDYDRHRLALGIPEGARDFEPEKLLILEGNLAELNGVSFTKGCYVGQELTARMHYRGKVRKRLLPVDVEGELPAPGTPVTKDGKEIGQIRSGREARALALLRVEDIEDGGSYACGSATLTVQIPDWLKQTVSA
ncbi:MAG: folate-binding protein [Alphaproteobacteria bacterium]|nr:MAG: folate-binding protein [Alphaproteobacteria bacterium]